MRRLLGKTFRRTDAPQQAPNNLRQRMAAGKMIKVGPNWPPIRQLGIIFKKMFFQVNGVFRNLYEFG